METLVLVLASVGFGGLGTCILGSMLLQRAKTRRLVAPLVNVIAGVVLPEPDDPRWELLNSTCEKAKKPHSLCLGKVVVHRECDSRQPAVFVDGMLLNKTRDADETRYVEAAILAYASRKAQESIEGDHDKKQLAAPYVNG